MPTPAAQPAGPTPEQLAAQRQAEEQARQMAEEAEKQQVLLQVQKHHEFLRSKADVVNRLKNTRPTYVEDKNITTTNGLKLKTIPPSSSPSETHSGFFGIPGAATPTVALLREPMADGVLTNVDRDWMKGPQALIEQRLDAPNKWAKGVYASLKTKAPPLPWKKFNELQPGDVLLIQAAGVSHLIKGVDHLLSGSKASSASHTVLYLGMFKGVKHFLENVPGEGPRIIFEKEFLDRYAERGAEVAKLAQPLNKKEASDLYGAAVEMASQNRKAIIDSIINGSPETNYGVWGKDNVVCSESDWALLKIAGREIPKSGDTIKKGLGVDFSPADFYKNEQYFLVSPLDLPQ